MIGRVWDSGTLCSVQGMGTRAHWGLEDWRHRLGAVGLPCYHAGRQPHLPLPAPLHLPETPHCSYQVSNLFTVGEMCRLYAVVMGVPSFGHGLCNFR